MALVIPAAFPDYSPDGQVDPGAAFYDVHAQRTVESQHWFYTQYGRCHASQAFDAAEVQQADATLTTWLTYAIRQRSGMTGLTWRYHVNSTNGGSIRVQWSDGVGGTGGTTTVVAAGDVYGTASCAGVTTGGVVFVEVQIASTGAPETIDLLSIEIHDTPLAAVP